MRKKVILTHEFCAEAISVLKNNYDLIIAENTGLPNAHIFASHPNSQALICFLSDTVDQDAIDALPQLKIIANFAVGYNNIDFEFAIKKGIWVTHTPDILTDTTADITLALILTVSRRIVEADTFLREGLFSGWKANLFLGKDLTGASLGIIGMGRIGLATALRAHSFRMKILYYSRTRKFSLEKKYGFHYLPFTQLVHSADIISLHIPYSPEVHHLFSRKIFDLMKNDAIFINVSRGHLMDEEYLAQKLEKNELFGAGLDVYEFEPKVTDRLKKLKNTVLLPHIGSASINTRKTMAQMTVESTQCALEGRIPKYLIPEWKKELKK